MTSARDAALSADLAAIAAGQRGVFTAAQAYACGYTTKEIQRLRQVRALVSVRRGVYAAASEWFTLGQDERHLVQIAALQLVLREPAVISHVSAGITHGLSLLSPNLDLLHVTRPGVDASRREAGVHHHCAELTDDQVVSLDGWQVTSLVRTGVDIAREATLPQAVAALDSALRLGVTRDDLTELCLACRNWPGARMAVRAAVLADGRAENAGESWSRVELTRLGVPPSDLQRKLYDDDGLIGITDFAWDPQRVVGELDGRLKYRLPPDATAQEAGEIVWAEKRREDRIRDAGYEVVRWVYADLYHPERLAARVRQALARGVAHRRTS